MDTLHRAIRLILRGKYALLATMGFIAVYQIAAPVYGAYGYFATFRAPFAWNDLFQLLAYGVPGPLCHAGLVIAIAYRVLTRKPLHGAIIPTGIAIAAWTTYWNGFLAHDFSHVVYNECSARFAEVSFLLESFLIAITGVLWLCQKTSEKTLVEFADSLLARAFLFRTKILLILWIIVAAQLVAPPLRADHAGDTIFTLQYVVYALHAAILISITRSVLRQHRRIGVQLAAVLGCSFLTLLDNREAMVWSVEFARILLTVILTAALRSSAKHPADA